ncbi:MAG: radical SAM protein [Planctomycetota bacterium]
MPDITLVNLNMLYMRYGEEIEREKHVPLGCLYLTRALEDAGFSVDFRDYQLCPASDPFDLEVFLDFLRDPAPVIGLSCMANLLPFTLLAMQALRQRYPDRTLILGGVGSTAVEEKILTRFPQVDIISRGEGELTAPELLRALQRKQDWAGVKGISYRNGHAPGPIRNSQSAIRNVVHNPARERIRSLDAIRFPAFEKVPLKQYRGYGMMTSRGCPYPCTFCSVAPVWNLESYSRSPRNIVEEMKLLNREAGVDLFLFQDEFFVSGKQQVMEFCRELNASGLNVEWKAFGRVNLVDVEMMHAMADCGCLELRFGIESGSDNVLKRIKKGFTAADSLEIVPKAVDIFARTDAFFVWGFPFETMEDFNQSLFQMVSFRMLGARILPSLLSLLPQTEIYRECVEQGGAKLEFCPYLLPEFVFTGHEVCRGGGIEIPERHRAYFDLILANPDIFPGFFHIDLQNNVLPKLELLREFGFYPKPQTAPPADNKESCGAHSPRIEPQELATRAGRG